MHEVRSSLVLVSMLRRERLCRATHNDFMINTNMNVMMRMKQQQQRSMVGRASNRSGVHGSHLPRTHSLDVFYNNPPPPNPNWLTDLSFVGRRGAKGEQQREERQESKRKRKHVEETVESHLKKSGQDTKSSN